MDKTDREKENAEWLDRLQSEEPQQSEAINDLRELLLHIAIYTISRNLTDFHSRDHQEIAALAEDCTQEALVAILDRLNEFRGDSRFTTWAYKFAVHKALESSRRERWKGRSLDPLLEETDLCHWVTAEEKSLEYPEEPIYQAEIWRLIHQVICQDLTERQRQVVKLMVFDSVPMDVVTERLKTNRNAVYKVLHDARRKIRGKLNEYGYSTNEIMALFSTPSPNEDTEKPEGDCL